VAPVLAVLDTELEHLCRQDEQLRRLCTVPYVGSVTACAFASAVDNPERFGSAHQVEAHLELDRLTRRRARSASAGKGVEPAPGESGDRP
jgi:transposase